MSANRSNATAHAASGKELGNVTRFLNRVLGLPIHRQNFVFNYFLAVLSADIRTAKAEGRYSEGMSDLPASQISFACPPEVRCCHCFHSPARLLHMSSA